MSIEVKKQIKMEKFNKITLRILVSIPISIFLLITFLYIWLSKVKEFLLYGGEFISYEKDTKKTIFDVYKKLEEKKHWSEYPKEKKRKHKKSSFKTDDESTVHSPWNPGKSKESKRYINKKTR